MPTEYPPSLFSQLDEDIKEIKRCSRLLAFNPDYRSMSSSELKAAAIVNNQRELLPCGDWRKALIDIGPAWASAIPVVLFQIFEGELAFGESSPHFPLKRQRFYFGR